MAIKLYEFLDVSGGLQADQFGIGARRVLFECRVDKVSTFGQP